MIPLLIGLVLGCSDKGDDSTSVESDTDTDTDSDSDTDADTDSDTDTDTDPSAPSDPDEPLAGCESLEHADWKGDDLSDDEYLRRYDADGNLVYSSSDYGADHAWDSVTTYEYDESGNVIRTRWDDGADDSVELQLDYTYDTSGNLLTETRTEEGVVVEVRTSTYDGSGTLETIEIDAGANGSVDDLYWVTIEVDGSGATTTTQELDEGNDGSVESVITLVESADGTEVMGWIDDGPDGDTDFLAEWTYDDYGNLIHFLTELYDEDSGDVLLYDLQEVDTLDDWHRIATYHEVLRYWGTDEYQMSGTYAYTCE